MRAIEDLRKQPWREFAWREQAIDTVVRWFLIAVASTAILLMVLASLGVEFGSGPCAGLTGDARDECRALHLEEARQESLRDRGFPR